MMSAGLHKASPTEAALAASSMSCQFSKFSLSDGIFENGVDQHANFPLEPLEVVVGLDHAVSGELEKSRLLSAVPVGRGEDGSHCAFGGQGWRDAEALPRADSAPTTPRSTWHRHLSRDGTTTTVLLAAG
jgi:hypothetical protein